MKKTLFLICVITVGLSFALAQSENNKAAGGKEKTEKVENDDITVSAEVYYLTLDAYTEVMKKHNLPDYYYVDSEGQKYYFANTLDEVVDFLIGQYTKLDKDTRKDRVYMISKTHNKHPDVIVVNKDTGVFTFKERTDPGQ